jgi:hypothetical protein
LRTRWLLGEYRPDSPPNLSNDLSVATNCYAISNGYAPVKDLVQVAPALTGTYKGAAAFISSSGGPRVLAGNGTNLYRLTGGTWTSVIGSLSVNGFWQFAQFGDNIICVNGDEPIDFDLLLGTAAPVAGSPPTADLVAVVRDFVVLGRAGGNEITVAWSDLGDHTVWSSGQAGQQPLYQGGKVMGLAGGEYGLILQRFAVTRMTYTGDESDPFQFDTISTNYGCAAEKSIAQAGDLVFFWSDRGFVQIQAGQISPIGAEKVDRTFGDTYAAADLTNIWTAVDPQRTLVLWVMPGRVWAYNWSLQRWTTWEIAVQSGFTYFTANMTLAQIDALYGNLDAVPYSLDHPIFAGGQPRVALVALNGTFNVLGGPNLAASFKPGSMELSDGRKSRLRWGRPLTDADEVTLNMFYGDRLSENYASEPFTYLADNGDMPVRLNARYVRPEIDIAAGKSWGFVQGAEFEYELGGRH